MSRSVKASMATARRPSRVLRLGPLFSVLTLGACASVLGIEDIHEGPAPGAAGDDSTGSGGTAGTAGKANAGGEMNTGATDAVGGEPASGGTGTVEGGSGNEGGSGMAGAPNTDPTVRGQVVDYWGHAVPNIPVQIGETLTSTDQDGEFVVEDVTDTYDVSFHVEFDQYGTYGVHRSFAWVYQGLSRRDPRLQVIWGLPLRSGDIQVTPQNITLTANQAISVAIGGNDGNSTLSDVGAAGVSTSATWEGPETSQATAHGLCFQYDAATELPTSYLSYDTSLVTLSLAEEANITLDLTPATLDSGNVPVTVTPASNNERGNQAFLRFDSGVTLPLIDDYPGTNSFSFLLPSIPKSSLTVAAYEGDAYYSSYSVAHKSGLSITDEPALVIPTPITLTSPATEIDGVDGTTTFAFQSPASNPGPFVVHFNNVDQLGPYQTLYVVTEQKQLTIPEVVGGGFQLKGDNYIEWRVATHGTFASVDEMAGPEGFLDPFAVESEPVGPNTRDGQYSISAARLFITAP